MATVTTTIGYGFWNDRKTLDYVPCNSPLEGRFYGPFGSLDDKTRRPYKIEQNGNTTYIMYDDDNVNGSVIYKMVEA